MVIIGIPKDSAKGKAVASIITVTNLLVEKARARRVAVPMRAPTASDIRTPIQSINHPQATPNTVLITPYMPYIHPAFWSEMPNSSVKKSVMTSEKEK
mmetsp:Transcript_28593/g.69587  ORF Transcript_28593/g.69587 Transcript_28593/m.69587 type:complete len:98 (+) Transcript_28593:1530-1823(+)